MAAVFPCTMLNVRSATIYTNVQVRPSKMFSAPTREFMFHDGGGKTAGVQTANTQTIVNENWALPSQKIEKEKQMCQTQRSKVKNYLNIC